MSIQRALSIVLPGMLIAIAAIALPAHDARAVTPLTPNLQPLKASSLRIETPGDGRTYLRFSTTSWNSGAGPVEIVGGEIDSATSKQQVYQRVYNDDGSYEQYGAGSFDWHAGHSHMHFNDYALYTLDAVSAPGASLRTAAKTTFCIIDTTRVKRSSATPRHPVYTTCGSSVQGMSVGWGDTYGYNLEGQAFDVTGLPDGDYTLTIEIDPKRRIIETNDGDNVSVVTLRLRGGSVSIVKR
jgi:hypothetical protein